MLNVSIRMGKKIEIVFCHSQLSTCLLTLISNRAAVSDKWIAFLLGLGFSPVYLTYNHEKHFIKSPAQVVWYTRLGTSNICFLCGNNLRYSCLVKLRYEKLILLIITALMTCKFSAVVFPLKQVLSFNFYSEETAIHALLVSLLCTAVQQLRSVLLLFATCNGMILWNSSSRYARLPLTNYPLAALIA